MKKLTIFSSIAAAALAIAGCQKPEIETVVPGNGEGSAFELYAEIAQTKTTLDANTYEVAWKEGDVIYMVTSDGPWGVPYAQDPTTNSIATFTYSGGKFTTPASIAEGKYTFNAVYSNGKQMSYHRSDGTTNQLYATQTQDCADPTAHIKAYDALVGTFTAIVPSNEPATVDMKHIYTLMQVDVKNDTGADINITKFEMTVPGANLAGVFAIDFNTAGVEFNKTPSETIAVNVINGTVKAGESLPIYFVAAPFASAAETGIKFKVTTESGATYTKTAKKALEFKAGQYNTTPYTISTADEVEPEPEGTVSATISFATKDQRTEYSTTTQVWENEGIKFTNNKGESTTNVGDYAGPGRFYKSSEIIINAPGSIYVIEFDCNGIESKYVSPWKDIIGANLDNNVVTFTLDASSNQVSFTTTAQVRANSVKVVYSGEAYVPPTLVSIAVSGDYKTEFTQGSEFSFDGVVTATYDNGSTKNVTAACEFTGYDLDELGDQTVTVSYTENDVTKTEEYDIIVNEAPAEPLGATIEEFLAAEPSTAVWYKLTGTISNITNTTYGNFNLEDETGSVYVYGLTATQVANNDQSFASLRLKEGDVVTLIGTRAVYNNSPQVGGPAYYVSHISACDAPVITCADNMVTIEAEDGATIYYTINGDEPTETSTKYTGAFAITETVTVKAIAVATEKANSVIVEKVCTYVNPNAGGGESAEPVTLIIDGATLTSTATTADSDHNFGDITLTMSKGAKYQKSTKATNAFSDNPAILIGKSGAYIYNKTPIPGRITKFEIYSNEGASAKVSIGVNFSSTKISEYNANASNTYKATLSTLNSIYDCSNSLPDNAQYFWYQVTNANNSQVQFRITYIPEN